MYWKRGIFFSVAAARAAAKETARVALAPSFSLFSVPSSSIIVLSMSFCSNTDLPTKASRIKVFTLLTAFLTPLPK